MRYILYARRSSEEKTRQVQSIEDQVGALQAVIEQNGLDVRHLLTESRTAKEPGRPIFNQMIKILEAGEADAILCWHLNRLTRNELDSGTVRWLLRKGVIREIVTPHRTYLPEDNALITAVESAMSEQFIVELTHNSERGMLSKVEKGWFPGHVPPGYSNDVTTHTIVRDEQRWELIRQAWREMATGLLSVPQVLYKLNHEWGYRSVSGKPMARSTLFHIFTNPFYTGVFAFRGVLHAGKHEAMVSRQEFDFVQARLSRRGNRRPRKHEFAFSGLITCGHCGRAVCGDHKRKILKSTGEEQVYTYYACSQTGRTCPRSGRITEDEIVAAIAQHLQSIRMPEEFAEAAREVARRFDADLRCAEDAVEKELEATKARIDRQLEELLTLRLECVIDTDEYHRRKSRLQGERNEGAAERQRDQEREAAANQAVLNVADFSRNAADDFATACLASRGAIARQLGASYVLNRGVLAIELHGLLGLVRVENKKADPATHALEPLEIGSGSAKGNCSRVVCAGWGPLLDAIRAKAYKERLYFPAYPMVLFAAPVHAEGCS